MKTINIKGKEYVTVNERLKEFRNNFKDYALITEIVELGADYATIKASIIDDKGVLRATGFAREVVAKSPINKFAFLENCETSAIGRALGNFGIGIDDAVCTADELLMKLSQDKKEDKASQDTEFSKEAKTWKTANTKAVKQAVANGEEHQPAPSKKTIEERTQLSIDWLNSQTPTTYLNATKGQKDYINNLANELRDSGKAELLDNLMAALDRASSIDDSINY